MILNEKNRERLREALTSEDVVRIEGALMLCGRYAEHVPEAAPAVIELVRRGKSLHVRNLAGRVMLGLPSSAALRAIWCAIGKREFETILKEAQLDAGRALMDAVASGDIVEFQRLQDDEAIMTQLTGALVWHMLPQGLYEDDDTYSEYGDYILVKYPDEDKDDNYG